MFRGMAHFLRVEKRWGLLVLGMSVSIASISLAASEEDLPPSSGSSDDTAVPSSLVPQKEGEALTPLAHQLLELAKERLTLKRESDAKRQHQRSREQAQKTALELAREKAREEARREQEATRQLQLARERNLKLLYQRSLSLYRSGAYQEAIETLQQLPLIDPDHSLVKTADRLMLRAEMKLREQQVRDMIASQSGGTRVSELEQQLSHKRIELETALKYAKIAARERNYTTAMDLLTRVLEQDPSNHQAQQLMEQVQLASLERETNRLERQVAQDEHSMINDVLKRQVLPESLKAAAMTHPSQTSRKPLMQTKLQQPVSFDFEDVALGDVLDFLADGAGISIIPSPQLNLSERRVTLRAQEMPLEMAIKSLAKSQSLSFRVEDSVILIATQEEFASAPMETRVFFLSSGIGPFALEASAIEPNPALVMDSLQDMIQAAIPQPSNSKLVVDARSGAFIMTNTKENLDLVEQLLSQLDVTPIQVLIETRFLEVTLTEFEQLAMEAVLTGNVALTRKNDPDQVSRGTGHQLSSGSGMKFPALTREDEGLNVTLQGVLTGTQFESVLHLLEETKKSKTLSAPRVTTLNNKTAVIRVVDEFRYPTRYEVSLVQFDINGDGDFDDAGETEFANVPQDLQSRDIGILLHVTPSVGKDLKTITLILAPEVSQFSQFRNLGGGVTVPEFTSSQLATSVVIEDGQTAVLGGLMTDSTSESLTKVPLLGDLPLVGGLFRQSKESNTRKNLLIFITARILAPPNQTT